MFEFIKNADTAGQMPRVFKNIALAISQLVLCGACAIASQLYGQAAARSTADLGRSDHFRAGQVAGTNPVNFESSNLPIIVIDTFGQAIPDEPKISAHMGIIYHGDGIRNNVADPFNEYDGQIGIELRGSSAQSFPKKSYAVETRDSRGNNLNVSLLGFPAENDWVLYGPYSDKSLIRNILAYRLANSIGRYASRSKCCELVLNGEYLGVYVLMEKIKRDKNRVNIKSIQPTDITGNALTGGYMIKIDKPAGAKLDGWQSPFIPYPGAWQRIFYQYHYPDQDEIAPQQKSYIQNFITQFESMMARADYADPDSGYPSYIDVDSFVDFFILSEIAKNVDAYRLSTFFYKDRDSSNPRLFIGPIWDYNLAFGNADYYNCRFVSDWQVDFYQPDDNWQNPFWWRRLMADSNFTRQVSQRWYALRKNQFTVQRIYAIIDSLAHHLHEAQMRNFDRWPILSAYVWPNAFIGGNYPAEIRYLKQWVQSRMLWMDARMPGPLTSIASTESPGPMPDCYLAPSYPNPFNHQTTIAFFLARTENIHLEVYAATGKRIIVLASGMTSAGWHKIAFNGEKLASGIYICRLTTPSAVRTGKLTLVK